MVWASVTAAGTQSAALLQGCLQFFNGDLAQLGYYFTVDFDRRELQTEKPPDDGSVGLLDYFDVERAAFPEFCDHRTDILSFPSGWVVEIKSDKHGVPP